MLLSTSFHCIMIGLEKIFHKGAVSKFDMDLGGSKSWKVPKTFITHENMEKDFIAPQYVKIAHNPT